MALARRTKLGLAVSAAVLVALGAWLAPPLVRYAERLAAQGAAPVRVSLFESPEDAGHVSAIRVGCYPSLGPEGYRYTDDPAVVAEALAAFEPRAFKRWDGRAQRLLLEELFPSEPMTGGCYASVAFLDASGDELAVVLDNSGVAPRGFLSVRRNDCVYLLEGDATASGACLDAMIADACADDDLRPDWYERADPPLGQMTWLLEEEWRARRGLPASDS